MVPVNLIPLARREARRRRGRVRWWIAACTVYVALMLAGLAVAQRRAPAGADRIQADLAASVAAVQRAHREIAQLQSEVSRLEARTRADRMVIEQPDWSVLLAMLAATLGEEIVLNQVTLEPPEAARGGEGGPAYRLVLSGLGRTQQAVSQFALDLERYGLLDSVVLEETRRERFLAEQAVGFRIHSTIRMDAQAAEVVDADLPAR